ncbi:MAG: biopolymer transporter ExbD [Candidatus Eisenbacteria bacterium]|uniref:Biopolymer transporter ExbD n=1 Tax=Eiseniibacteriota bacterium TaxID=2212470 RepID=A0A956M145_UNCEI|nr:biopolymer transporter ExbD [Candidatus Eisenbacteria bacterium]
MARFERSIVTESNIPTSSMADIAFLLLIFFIVTTIFRIEQGLPIVLPRAEAGEKLPRQHLANIYIDLAGDISIDDKLIHVTDIEPLLVTKLQENSQLVVGLKFDEGVPYRTVDQCLQQMKSANALNTAFTVEQKLHGRH